MTLSGFHIVRKKTNQVKLLTFAKYLMANSCMSVTC